MNLARFRFVPALIFLLLLAVHTRAQEESVTESMRQYPGFLELTTAMKDGTVSVLRCGYAMDGGTVTADDSFRELSVLNRQRKSYSRIQRIDGQLIATATDPRGKGMLLELIRANGTVSAKRCGGDPATDTVGDCHTMHPFTFIDQIRAGDAKIGKQCEELLQRNGPRFNRSIADPAKTAAFKDALRQKAAMLASP